MFIPLVYSQTIKHLINNITVVIITWRRNSLSSTTNSTEDSNSNSSNSVERRQLDSQISLKNQKCNLLPDHSNGYDVHKQEDWNMNGETDVKPQDCKATSSKQEDNHDTATTNNKATNETETLSLQGKITNSSNAKGGFSPLQSNFFIT